MNLIINTDGGSRGNPGPGASGVIIKNEKQEILFRGGEFLGKVTNNQAEYMAVLFALEKCEKLNGSELHFRLDSELVVKQINGEYKIKDATLGQIFLKIYNLQSKFKKVIFTHIRREQNAEADAVVNEILDQRHF
ncbi:MAG: ribonuclease HI family protein [Patescibacteria group bacterium]